MIGINSAQNFRDLPHWLISYHCTFWMAPSSEAYSRVLRSNCRLRGIETNSIPVHDNSAITFGAINCVAFYKCHSHSPPTRPVGETLRAPGRVNLRQQYARMNIKLLNEPCKMISYTGVAALKHWLLIQLLNEEQPRICHEQTKASLVIPSFLIIFYQYLLEIPAGILACPGPPDTDVEGRGIAPPWLSGEDWAWSWPFEVGWFESGF